MTDDPTPIVFHNPGLNVTYQEAIGWVKRERQLERQRCVQFLRDHAAMQRRLGWDGDAGEVDRAADRLEGAEKTQWAIGAHDGLPPKPPDDLSWVPGRVDPSLVDEVPSTWDDTKGAIRWVLIRLGLLLDTHPEDSA